MTSYFQPSRLMMPVLIFLVIAALSYWLNPGSWQHMSTAKEAIFAGSFVVVMAVIVVARKKMYLKMDVSGLEVQLAAGAPRRYAWGDIDAVKIVKLTFLRIPLASSIHLRLRPGMRSENALRKLAGIVNGSDTSFPAFFDASAEEIAEQIEYFRRENTNAPQSGRTMAAGTTATG